MIFAAFYIRKDLEKNEREFIRRVFLGEWLSYMLTQLGQLLYLLDLFGLLRLDLLSLTFYLARGTLQHALVVTHLLYIAIR